MDNITTTRKTTQRFADDVTILGSDDIRTIMSTLSLIKKMKFQYSWTNNLDCILNLLMPLATHVLDIVKIAQKYGHKLGISKDE